MQKSYSASKTDLNMTKNTNKITFPFTDDFLIKKCLFSWSSWYNYLRKLKNALNKKEYFLEKIIISYE